MGGSGAQEEELRRRTSLYRHLVLRDFPRGEFEVHYHSPICVIKGPRTKDFGFLVDPFWISVISGPVYHRPKKQLMDALKNPTAAELD